MIIKVLFAPIFALIKMVIGLFPSVNSLPNFLTYTINLLKGPLGIFPSDLWKVIFVNLVFWITVHFGWAIIEWVYKKIPGVE